MHKPLELFIGGRYTLARRRNRFVSFISFASVLGIMVGVMFLITILSVMNGLELELRERLLGISSHVTIYETDGRMEEWSGLQKQVKTLQGVKGVAPFVEKQVLLSDDKLFKGMILQGIDPDLNSQVSNVSDKLLIGQLSDLKPRSYGLVLGAEAAQELNVGVGDKLTVIVPKLRVTPLGVVPRIKRFTVIGIHKVNMQAFDSLVALVNIEDGARIFGERGSVKGLRVMLDDALQAPEVAQSIARQLGERYRIVDWSQENKVFFDAIRTEKVMMTIILFLVVCVAVFNLIASLVMSVNEKQSDVAILQTLGLAPQRIRRIFMIQGSILGVAGTVLGVVLGVLLSLNVESLIFWLESSFNFKIFPDDLFYISKVPSTLKGSDVAVIASISLLLSILATIYPAIKAQRIQPAESLRYE